MKLYDELADWWPLLSAPEEYEEEADDAVQKLQAASRRPLREVLELGSGGGNTASYLKRHFAMTLVDPAAGMRAVSEALNPECTHLPGDMRTVRLGRTFDAVFVHDAVSYMVTEADLKAAMTTVAVHLAPGGAALFLPDYTTETFEPGTETGGHDEPPAPDRAGCRSMRWLEWRHPLVAGTSVVRTDYALLLRERDGSIRAVHDRHETGVFPRATWLRLLKSVGLVPAFGRRRVDGVDYDEFVAAKPGAEA